MRAKKQSIAWLVISAKMGMTLVRGKTIRILLIVPFPLTLKTIAFKVAL